MPNHGPHRRAGDSAMTTKDIVVIILTILGSMAASYAQTRVTLQDVDTRERINSAAAERAIERVAKEATDHVERVDQNVQWLIKEMVQISASVKRIERKLGDQ